jgi:hypothetical protein
MTNSKKLTENTQCEEATIAHGGLARAQPSRLPALEQ